MTWKSIQSAEREAKRFLEKCKQLREGRSETEVLNDYHSPWPSRRSGAVKRASMDLSQALVDLRRGS